MNVLIKFSGEFFDAKDALSNEGQQFLNVLKKNNISSGYCVVGGGNRMRGQNSVFERNASDKIGVLSTIMNGLILQESFKLLDINAVVFSHFADFGKKYNATDAINAYNQNKWVVLTSGLGSVGYVSTDLSSVIKALELKVDMMIKVTKVAGIYDKDPSENDAKLLNKVNYNQVLKDNLKVMDLSAIAIAEENNLKIGITNIENFEEFIKNNSVGSVITK